LAGIYASALLSLETTDPGAAEPDAAPARKQYKALVANLSTSGPWEEDYATTADLVDGKSIPYILRLELKLTWYVAVTHYILDLYVNVQSLPAPTQGIEPSPVSPPGKTPTASNQPSSGNTAFPIPSFWTAQTLTELKIYLRNKRPGAASSPSWPSSEMEEADVGDIASEGFGQNEGTVRFLWDKVDVKA
jgi:CTD kinase subunit beta